MDATVVWDGLFQEREASSAEGEGAVAVGGGYCRLLWWEELLPGKELLRWEELL